MIGVCTRCSAAYETTEEDANAPDRICPPCHWAPEAVRLIDTFGEWAGGREWWAAAGYPGQPPWGLMDAVKREQWRREDAARPPVGEGSSFISITPRE